jgi:hypothetical protein
MMTVYLRNVYSEKFPAMCDVFTHTDILNEYWDYWRTQVHRARGFLPDYSYVDMCIEDWCTVNYAWAHDHDMYQDY